MRKIDDLKLPMTDGKQEQVFTLDEWLYLWSVWTYDQADQMLEDRFVRGIEIILGELSLNGEAKIYDDGSAGELVVRGRSLVLVSEPRRKHGRDAAQRRTRLTIKLAVVA